MDVIEIFGGKPLKGKIRISGSKNSALPILASTLLTNSTVMLTNIPSLSDIFSMIDDELNSSEENFGDIIPTESDFRRGFQV